MIKMNDKTERVTVRLSKIQIEFLENLAKSYNCSVSEVVRMFVNMQIYNVKKGG